MVAVLSFSAPDVETDCAGVVRVMQELRLFGDVTPNCTIEPDGRLERGCRVLVANKSESAVRALWGRVRSMYAVECAHVSLTQSRQGCVFDVFGPSRCPGVEKD